MSRRAEGKLPRARGAAARSDHIASRSGESSPPEVPGHHRWLAFAVCLSLALAVWAVFGQTLHHEFINYDDDLCVYKNPAVTRGLNWSGVVWAFTHSVVSNWQPLTTLSHMLDCQLWGLNPGMHHLTNVLLHAATAILLFLVLRKMTGRFWPAAFVAAVFALHPLRVESVAWVTERKDVLSGLFFMLTLWAYSHYTQVQRLQSTEQNLHLASRFYVLSIALFTLGLMSKPTLVTLPFLLLLLDYWPLQRFTIHDSRSTIGRLALEKIPFLLLSAASCVVTIFTQRDSIVPLENLAFPWRVGNAVVAYAAYLGQMLYPVRLAVFYPHPGSHLSMWNVGVSMLVLVLISAGVMGGRRKHPYLLVGWLWYLGMLVPVIGLMDWGSQARADRFTYLPQIGVYLMVAWGAVEICGSSKHRRIALACVATAILGTLLALAHSQTAHWKNSLSLWTHTLAGASDNFLAHNNLAAALADQGKYDEAIQHYERALQLKPDIAEIHTNLGDRLADLGRLDAAIQHYEWALQLKPDYELAHYNLGVALASQGKFDEAIQQYERALQLNPGLAEAHNNLGIALVNQGKLTEAIQQYERALQLKSDDADVHNNLGNALTRQGKLDEAIPQFKRALQLNPDFALPHFNLGMVLAAQGKLNEAVPHLQQALNLAMAQNTPALVEAIRTRLKAVESASPQPQMP